MNTIIDISNLYVYYKNNCALSNINLSVNEGDFLAIMGPNGGGKSTLLKTILGLLKPNKGTIKIMDELPQDSKGVIGYAPQFSKFDKNFPITVKDVVLTGTLAKKNIFFHTYGENDYKIIYDVMKRLNIYDLRNKQIGQLSGGQLQRVLIARAISMTPKILLLDEPTASIDSESKTEIYSILKELNKNMTIIIVTHDIGAICSYVTSIACINKSLFYHGEAEINDNIVEQIYGCPIDLIAHGIPHRVLKTHKEGK
ncbi:high-affinity zinc uptake system ATP-binding protein ZnuC [Clostridium tepidiprofundi DSM 19306]|uniref:High-affinity zinc uptake system ATP-binding protein ZnuC n=1 Tax=Clostridium tepidiprofundi DSM 19306 TaxID=1121338 RepID=A0A151ATE3_9CLOT|nr:metal ABC transporter ATP-binding protein [Clostridium tepidiprofundi]KYH30885.1 high-affinity zinc uptake system ATP-binding protein ZnuC [Clostridium tepidiprofundi DSM 19306]